MNNQEQKGEGHVVTLTEKSGHLAWCALVALALARQKGDVLSPAQENIFLGSMKIRGAD